MDKKREPLLNITGNEAFEMLIDQIIREDLSMVQKHKFQTVLRNFEEIDKLEGDIVECGSWKGGFSIFMSHLFSSKRKWVCDSFTGFQPIKDATYVYGKERHTEELFKERMTLSLDEVKKYFKRYGLSEEKNISFLEGYVKDTLSHSVCPIENIALLRIDVDSYSATKEVLDFLYPKVVKGGYIVFDDSEIFEANSAIQDYFKEHEIEIEYLHPVTDNPCTDLPAIDLTYPWCTSYPDGYLYNGKLMPTGLYIIKK
jgi:hypothetical protein